MNKTELVEVVATKNNLKKKDSEAVIACVFDAIAGALASGEKVQISGFGSFEVKERAERKGRNPQTKAEMVIPASRRASFSASKAIKDLLNK